METTLALMRQRVQTLAEEYRGQGYDVVVEPSKAQLPPFLAGYHPDLLLHKASESVVVEVRPGSPWPRILRSENWPDCCGPTPVGALSWSCWM